MQRTATTLTTKYGDVEIVATSPDHLHVSTNNGATLTVRKVPYSVSMHMRRWADGTWHLGKQDDTAYERSQWLHASRTDRYTGPRDLYASQPARDALRTELERVVNEWAPTPDAVALIDAGTRYQAELDMSRVRNDLSKVRTELARLEAEETHLLGILNS